MPLSIPDLLSAEGAIARRLTAYEPRPQQVEMAAAVDRALEQRGRLIVEAGTGVGKSFAYLVPAIKRIVDHGERVVISTHTIALQEQLIEKDIPLLNAVIPGEFSAVLVKGRNNYVSLRRLKLASERQDRLFASADARASLHMLEDWAYDTTDGTRSSLPVLPRSEVWDAAQSDSHNCMGRKCATYDKCFYQAARRRMENGDLLVCNHALFFSDLSLRRHGAGFLPPYDHVILDEAHAAEEVAADHFGLSLSESRVNHLLRMLYDSRRRKGFLATFHLPDGTTALIDRAVNAVLDCRDAATAFFDDLVRWQRSHARANGRMREPHAVPNHLTEPMETLRDLLRMLKAKTEHEPDQFELKSYARRAEEIALSARILLGQEQEGCVYFLEGAEAGAGSGTRRGRRRVTLRCVTVDVGPVLREHLFETKAGVVLTSATLASGPDDFTHLQARLGCDDPETLQLGSPFDFVRQMRVLVDPRMPEPSDPRYVDALVPRVDELIRRTRGGAFVLFTSFRMLEQVAGALRGPLEDDGFPVLVQGADGPPGLLLRRFRDDTRSVLFGTVSFWQGVDVRGEGLRNVIITRLPFEVPDRPLVEARHERIKEEGGAPFSADQLPRALIRFRQGVGRLIRSGSDTGLVAVLDPRIVTKGYGRLFQRALPDGIEVQEIDADG